MLRHIKVRNVREAYATGVRLVIEEGVRTESRNGATLTLDGPLVTTYERPAERVLLDAQRDANPFFHLMEAIWMLAGRRDVESLMRYNAGMKKYSDDGITFHGAYGYRWRHYFTREDHWCSDGSADTPLDQLAEIVRLLRADPNDRRIVLQMWDPSCDLGVTGLDFPCNNLCYFRVRQEPAHSQFQGHPMEAPYGTVSFLDMTIVCRSNDMVWGGYGANAVHFSVLQEFVASMLGVRVGEMHQLSNNAHVYEATMPQSLPTLVGADYGPTVPLFGDLSVHSVEDVLADIEALWDGDPTDTLSILPPSLLALVGGMRVAWDGWKEKDWDWVCIGLEIVHASGHADWHQACTEWMHRRRERMT